MKSLKIPGSEMLRMSSQLALMLDVGVTAYEAIRALAANEPNPKLKDFLQRIESNIGSGMRLSEAISIDPTPFTEAQVSMIEAGETGGFLPKVLQRIAEMLEAGEELKRQVKSALTFPMATIIIAIGILVYMLVKVVPNFIKIFEDANVPLPMLTQIVVNVSAVAAAQPIITVAIAIGVCYFIYTLPSLVEKNAAMQGFVLGLPTLGRFLMDKMVAEFFSMMGQLISAGVTLERSLIICQGLSPYKMYQETIESFVSNIRSGITLSVSMDGTVLFGAANAQITKTGEDSGRLADVLSEVGRRYEKELSYKLKLVTTYAELVAIGISGVIVGVIVYAMFIPMLDLSSTIH